jgi:hypothetical protein
VFYFWQTGKPADGASAGQESQLGTHDAHLTVTVLYMVFHTTLGNPDLIETMNYVN